MSSSNQENKPFRLLLTGGGTGGHLFPAIATAEHLAAKMKDSQVLFIGTKRRLDRDALEGRGFPVKTIHSYGLKGKKLIELITSMVASDTWEEQGGYAKIAGLDGPQQGLVIAQTDQIHGQISDFLEKLRQATSK